MLRIERMTAARIDAVAALEQSCFVHPWSRQSLEDTISGKNAVFFAALEDGEVIGYAGMEVIVDEAYVFNIAVDERYRRRGTGYALVRELITYGKKYGLCFITLEVRESNVPAMSLYEKLGFIKVGERKEYYSDPTESAVLMTKYF
ncbi:MAG: ribosomal protein S18-alanine N-acetyltransferase [Ruminococcus sp.]|nr:ribosomal protein S18-alanine N-acetyltransferase [Ruminococcus sp.]